MTNGVYTTGNQTIGGIKTFSSQIDLTTGSGGIYRIIPGQATGSPYSAYCGLDDTSVYWDNTSAIRGYRWTRSSGATTLLTLDPSGNLTATANVTAYSDIRLKTDLTKIAGALAKVNQLNGYTYTRKDTGERHTGVVAQEVQAVLPEAVIDNGEHLSVAYGNMVGLLVEAIKELKAEVEALKK